jgi:hypothetical protein
MTTLFLLLAVDTVMAVIDPFTLSLIASGVTLGVQGIQQHVAGKRADAQALEARQQDERTLAANKFQSDSLFLKSYPTAGIEQSTFAKYGGWVNRIKKMGKGGPTPKKQNAPIFVTDPNDPRLKGFQDSLMLYKEGLLADSIISNKIKSLPPKLQSRITDTKDFILPGSPYETPDYNYTGQGVSNETAVISTYPMNPKTGVLSAGNNFIEFPRFNQSRVSGIAPTQRRTLGTSYTISPSKVKHDSSVTQLPFSDPNLPGYNFAQISKSQREVPVTEETFKNYRGVRGKPITTLEELRKAVGDDLSPDGSTIKVSEPNLFRSIDFYQAPRQPVFYQKPIPPLDTTPDPGSRLQIKSESGSWFDVDSFAPDYSQVRYGNTNVLNPDSSRLRSVPGRGAQMAAGGMIKRADGSYSKRGLWDNIRANKGSGKEPTAEMLKQERKIKAESKAMGGDAPKRGDVSSGFYNQAAYNPDTDTFKAQYSLPTVNVSAEDPRLKNAVRQGRAGFLMDTLDLIGEPQRRMMQGLTGKKQTPSEAWGFNQQGLPWYNPKNVADFAMDAVLDPINIAGVGLVDDVLKGAVKKGAKNTAEKTGKFLTSKTPLKNTYKLNPKAEKLNNPSSSYRVAGLDAAEDFKKTGILRSQNTAPPLVHESGFVIPARTTGFPSFQKGYADMNYLPKDGGVVFETNLPTFKRGDINPVTGKPITGRHYAHRVIDPETGKTLTEIPASDVKMYEPHWWKGYKQVTQKRAYGGSAIPDYIAEGGEVVDFNQGNVPQAGNFGKLSRLSSNMTKINGDSHDAPSGGVEMAGGERVYTDRIIVPQGFTSKLRKL